MNRSIYDLSIPNDRLAAEIAEANDLEAHERRRKEAQEHVAKKRCARGLPPRHPSTSIGE